MKSSINVLLPMECVPETTMRISLHLKIDNNIFQRRIHRRRASSDMLWASQNQVADIFEVNRPAISGEF